MLSSTPNRTQRVRVMVSSSASLRLWLLCTGSLDVSLRPGYLSWMIGKEERAMGGLVHFSLNMDTR